MSHKKFGPDRFSRFDVYWIKTNRQTDRQTDKPNLYIDGVDWKFSTINTVFTELTRWSPVKRINKNKNTSQFFYKFNAVVSKIMCI